jgi:hypothetical protein
MRSKLKKGFKNRLPLRGGHAVVDKTCSQKDGRISFSLRFS